VRQCAEETGFCRITGAAFSFVILIAGKRLC
jgi:hypothetical protein